MRPVIKQTISVITLIVLLSEILYANIKPNKVSIDTIHKRDLFEQGDSFDRAVESGKIKLNRLPQVGTDTGYNPSAAQSPIHSMPDRSKYDEGIMEGQNVQQYREQKKEEKQAEQIKIFLGILIVGFAIWGIWKMMPNRKPDEAIDVDKKESEAIVKSPFKNEIQH